ncbi:MAG: PepSY-associated TM helix domain-containing protein, partial [Bacteroidota bacterium]
MEEHQSDKRVYNSFFNTHTVAGIVISIGVFVIFLAGAFALFQNNIINWEVNAQKKEIPLAELDYDRMLDEVTKKGYQMYGRNFSINLSDYLGTHLAISASSPANLISKDSLGQLSTSDSVAYAKATGQIGYIIDIESYQLVPQPEQGYSQQRIGRLLTHLHYFRQIPVVGLYLSGLIALFFLFALVSGVIIHWKKMVSNFFTFRLRSSIKNLWTDGHTALGILGLPYQFMYAVTGAIFGLTILALPIGYLVFGDVAKATEIILPKNSSYELIGETDQTFSINPLVQQFLGELPNHDIKQFQVAVKSYGDENAHVTITSSLNTPINFEGRTYSTFRLTDGELVDQKRIEESSFRSSSFNYFLGLHYGNFGGLLVQIVYFLMAILTCFVIVSGVMIWLVAREKKTYAHKAKFNKNVGAIYLGACLGLYPAIAALFVTAKILPLDMEGRYEVINYVFFGFWLYYTIYAYFIKSSYRINKHAILVAGIFG